MCPEAPPILFQHLDLRCQPRWSWLDWDRFRAVRHSLDILLVSSCCLLPCVCATLTCVCAPARCPSCACAFTCHCQVTLPVPPSPLTSPLIGQCTTVGE